MSDWYLETGGAVAAGALDFIGVGFFALTTVFAIATGFLTKPIPEAYFGICEVIFEPLKNMGWSWS